MSMPADRLPEVNQPEADDFAALLSKSANQLIVEDSGEFASLLDTARFSQIQRIAKMFASSDLVPEVFQGKVANCAVALQMAFRLQVDPMMLMQNMYIVYGRPGIEAKLAIALMNARGPFNGPIQWRFEGEGKARKCIAYAIHKVNGERCEAEVTWSMVEAEGWDVKKGSKWKTIPDMMFRYRTATFLGRLYCPEVLLGLATSDELHDIGDDPMISAPKTVSMPRAKTKPAEKVDTETGEITNTPGSGGEAISGSVEPITSKASQEAEPPRAEPTEPAQKTAQKPPVIDDMSPITAPLQKVVRTKLETNGKTEQDLGERWGYGIKEIPLSEVNNVIDWICGKLD